MKHSIFKKLAISSAALLFSVSAFSGGGGGGQDSDGLPPPSTCTVNCGFENGPNPNLSFVSAAQGPFPVATTIAPRSVDGFGGGTVYYPSNLSSELAAIAVAPGFTAPQSAIQWWGPILASHGFVVITIDTNGRFDQPISRGRQLDSALSYLIDEGNRRNSPISGLVDENRLATMGHSMGGGGALRSAARNRLSASAPMAPFNVGGNEFDQIRVPTMIMGCQNDVVAPVGIHSRPFYNTIPDSTEKTLLVIDGGPHNCANGGANNDPLLATYGVSWMKRFLDQDRRYNRFLCGPNHVADPRISDYVDTCGF